jgi:thiamine-phosphate pyrophosphorylase
MAGFVAPALYLITDRKATAGRPLAEVVAAALRGAAPFRRAGRLPLAVSLREKDLPGGQLAALARALGQLTRAAGADLYVNGRVDVALACGAQGVHLPARTGLAVTEVRSLAHDLRVGVSTHTIEEVQAAEAARADFVVFGPVFETPSKQGLLATRGLPGLAAATASAALPVLALGGITPERGPLCRNAGARGLACIRAILSAADPEVETAAFLARFMGQN